MIQQLTSFILDVILSSEPYHTQMQHYICRIHDHFEALDNTNTSCNNDQNLECHVSLDLVHLEYKLKFLLLDLLRIIILLLIYTLEGIYLD